MDMSKIQESHNKIADTLDSNVIDAIITAHSSGEDNDLTGITSPLIFIIFEIFKKIEKQQKEIAELHKAHETLMLLFSNEIDK